MRRKKKYHPIPFLIIGLVGILCAFFVVRRLPGVSFLYMAVLAGSGAVILYGALNFLAGHLDKTPVRTVVNALRHIMQAAALLLVVAFGVVEYLIISGQKADAEQGADYLVVLGAGLRGETPSLILTERMNTAITYLKENPGTKAVLSGGRGEGEDITEAEAMRRYMEANGISPGRLLLEDKSTDTLENIQLSKSHIGDGASVVIVTSDFHLYRARRIAKNNGLDAAGLPADTPHWYLKAGNYTREFFAVVNMFLGKT